MNLFFENSTRTRTTFEAGVCLPMCWTLILLVQVHLNFTRYALEPWGNGCRYFCHSSSGAAHFIAKDVCPKVLMLEMDVMLIQRKRCLIHSPWNQKTIWRVECCDYCKHSRVARSDVAALQTLGSFVWLHRIHYCRLVFQNMCSFVQ